MNPLRIVGESVAGVNTCLGLPTYGWAFDMGRCSDEVVTIPLVFVSHGHMDHVGGVVYHAAQRALRKMPVGTYVVPKVILWSVEALFNAHGDMEGEIIPRNLLVLEPGDTYPVGKDLLVQPFQTHHRIPSQGYMVYRKRMKLLDEFTALPGDQIAQLRRAGTVVSRELQELEIAFTGDTTVAVFDSNPLLYQAKHLIVEVSFLGDDIPPDQAEKRGHIHLDDIIRRADLFQNETVTFMHFSARYKRDDIVRALDERVPETLRSRLQIVA